ncbi:MAG: UDP-N-acetylmuramoylalanine--D-glutamate ligase [Myxococcota bacterium]|jgi:UDP-N-acetylmuramoylalanine--D-glutamate ligase
MHTSQLADAKVGILGMGAEGRSVLAALRRWGNTGIVNALSDARTDLQAPGLRWRIGQNQKQGLDEIDVLIRSPGFPPHHPTLLAAKDRGLTITSATDLFVHAVRSAGLPLIGITGSKGKSTTATLTARILSSAGIDAVLVGNIGVPALDHLDDILARKLVSVFEMSSYQCHGLTLGPSIGVLLDLFPEHMDWHGGVESYYAAKLNLAATQRDGDVLLYNRFWTQPPGPATHRAINHSGDLHFADDGFWHGSEKLCRDDGMLLRGEHQRRNALSAYAAAEMLGATPSDLVAAITGFSGLPHRTQDLGVFGGIRWFDDAISTAPQAAAAAISALEGEVATLIAGGMNRGYDFAPLAAAIENSSVQTVLLMPDSGASLAALLADSDRHVEEVPDLDTAVARAAALTPPGRACLFSPASPSYNQFRSFKERGQRFGALVSALQRSA